MVYGDVMFTENSTLGEIEEIISSLGIAKYEEAQNDDISFEDFSNMMMKNQPGWWETLSKREEQDEYKEELQRRAESREVYTDEQIFLSEKLKTKFKALSDSDVVTVKHFLEERKKAYKADQAKAAAEKDFYARDLAYAQVEASARAQLLMIVVKDKSK